MSRLDNLGEKTHKFDKDEQRRGGKKSVETRRRKKELRECFTELLAREFTDAEGNTMTGAEAISAKIFSQALKGDKKAFEIIRDTAGQKPPETVYLQEVDADTVKEVEKMVKSAK